MCVIYMSLQIIFCHCLLYSWLSSIISMVLSVQERSDSDVSCTEQAPSLMINDNHRYRQRQNWLLACRLLLLEGRAAVSRPSPASRWVLVELLFCYSLINSISRHHLMQTSDKIAQSNLETVHTGRVAPRVGRPIHIAASLLRTIV